MDPLERRRADLAALALSLPGVRQGGWRWYSGLEAEIARLQGQAHEQLHRAQTTRGALTAPVGAKLDAVEAKRGDPAQRAALERELDALDDALVACERQLEQLVQGWSVAVERCLARGLQAQETLIAFRDAGFRLPEGERPLLAVRAAWLAEPEQPPGVVLLTDRRHRFERRDDRILQRNRAGVATERRSDRTVLLDEPHAALLAARDASSGFPKEPKLTLTWKSGAYVGQALTLKLERPGAAELAAVCEALRVGSLAGFG